MRRDFTRCSSRRENWIVSMCISCAALEDCQDILISKHRILQPTPAHLEWAFQRRRVWFWGIVFRKNTGGYMYSLATASFRQAKSGNRGELYRFHSGAPSFDEYLRAHEELVNRVSQRISTAGLGALVVVVGYDIPEKKSSAQPIRSCISAYGEELVVVGEENEKIFVLDADLVKDCGLVPFR